MQTTVEKKFSLQQERDEFRVPPIKSDIIRTSEGALEGFDREGRVEDCSRLGDIKIDMGMRVHVMRDDLQFLEWSK